MPVVAARTQNDVRDRTGDAPEFRIVITRGHVHRLNRFHRRHNHGQIAVVPVVVDPFDHEAARLPELAVDVARKAVLRIVERGVWAEGTGSARHQPDEPLVIPVERERQVFQSQGFDLGSEVRPVRLQNRGGGRNADGLIHRSHLQCKLHADGAVGIEAHALAVFALKPGVQSFHRVRAWIEQREGVVSRLVGFGFVDDVGIHLGHFDRSVGCRRAGAIQN